MDLFPIPDDLDTKDSRLAFLHARLAEAKEAVSSANELVDTLASTIQHEEEMDFDGAGQAYEDPRVAQHEADLAAAKPHAEVVAVPPAGTPSAPGGGNPEPAPPAEDPPAEDPPAGS